MRNLAAALLPFLLIVACSSRWSHLNPQPGGGDSSGGPGGLGAIVDSGPTGDGGASLDDGAVNVDAGPPLPCTTTFRFVPPAGRTFASVEVTGEFSDWKKPGVAMTGPDAQGAYTAAMKLLPGLHGYKLLLDGSYESDPGARARKYAGGTENSAVRVRDCRFPTLALESKTLARAAAGQGRFTARVRYADGTLGGGVDPATVQSVVRRDGKDTALTPRITADAIELEAAGLADGKYTVIIAARDKAGRPAKQLRLVFWVEAETFDWRDAVVYMVVTDRFKNGEQANDAPRTAGVEARADYQGGDLQGVRDAIRSGALDRLGVRALWLTPFNTNPAGALAAEDGAHKVTGYHGYWPTKAREVDARIGGAAALRDLIAEAHAHGIRILQDFVINHVHEQHEYFQSKPGWFRTGCVCGTTACDWTVRRLDCLFADYLPDVNWANNDATEQFSDDAVWWLTEFDIDGLRVDAVKHVEDAAVVNMAAKVRDELEAAGTRVFLTGETAMGWSDCDPNDPACNANDYGTISHYVGPHGLDGQFDFVLYHAAAFNSFFGQDRGMIHADVWTATSQARYPRGSIMTPYIGSHDTPRGLTLGQYRADRSVPGRKWADVAQSPAASESEAYARMRTALGWVLTLPGAPLLYYGDEYAQWGGADPNNRAFWRGDGALSAEEQATRALTEKLGATRKELVALRRGDYVSFWNTNSAVPLAQREDTLVFARKAGADVAIVMLSRAGEPGARIIPLPPSLGVADGTVLRDRIGGGTVTAAGGSISVSLPARAVAIYAP